MGFATLQEDGTVVENVGGEIRVFDTVDRWANMGSGHCAMIPAGSNIPQVYAGEWEELREKLRVKMGLRRG